MADPAESKSAVLPFHDFLEYLRTRDFVIGVDHHIRLWRVLAQFEEVPSPEKLEALLCPILASSARQQDQFHRAFESYFAPILHDTPAPEPRGGAGDRGITLLSSPPPRRLWWRKPAAIAAVVALLGVIAGVWLAMTPAKKGNLPKEPVPTPQPQQTPLPATTPAPTTPSPEIQDISGPVSIPLPLGFLAFCAILVLIPLITWGMAERRAWRGRQLVLERNRGRKPPLRYRLELPPARLVDLSGPLFYSAVRKLRRRQPGYLHRLDIPRTLAATIQAGGLPTFRYSPDSRYPEYLLLIDRVSLRDHQAQWFDAVGAALEDEGVFLERYFFDADPRICRNAAGGSVRLNELRNQRPDHRLLVISDGARLVDPVTAEAAAWTGQLAEWPERAFLTPVPEERWGHREASLKSVAPLLPATIEGLDRLADQFNGFSSIEKFRDRRKIRREPLHERFPSVAALRQALGPEAFQWLCACATYPELHWRLTLHLGSLPAMPPGLVAEPNLLKLTRIHWFREGAIPDEPRVELIDALDPKIGEATRTAIVALLERTEVDEGTVAADHRQLDLAAQLGPLQEKDPEALKKTLESIESLPVADRSRDYALIRFLKNVPRNRLAMPLPQHLQRIFGEVARVWPWVVLRGLLAVIAIVGLLMVAEKLYDALSAVQEWYLDFIAATWSPLIGMAIIFYPAAIATLFFQFVWLGERESSSAGWRRVVSLTGAIAMGALSSLSLLIPALARGRWESFLLLLAFPVVLAVRRLWEPATRAVKNFQSRRTPKGWGKLEGRDAWAPSLEEAASPNAKRLLWVVSLALFSSGVGFAIQGSLLAIWAREYGFTGAQLSSITGMGAAGFCGGAILTGLIVDKSATGECWGWFSAGICFSSSCPSPPAPPVMPKISCSGECSFSRSRMG